MELAEDLHTTFRETERRRTAEEVADADMVAWKRLFSVIYT